MTLPNDIGRNPSLSLEARGFLVVIASMSSDWTFYRQEMMRIAGVGKDKYYKIINELKAANILHIDDGRGSDGTFSGRTWHVNFDPCPENTDTVDPCPDLPCTVLSDGGETRTHKKKNLIKNTKPKEIKTKQKDLVSSEFEKIWVHYRKIKDAGKAKALAKYKVARKSHSYEQIAKPLAQFIEIRTGQDPKYTPHLATWLHGKRWNDNQAHAANASRTSDDQLDGLMGQSSDAQLDNLFPERKALTCH